jgi:hypothetical protein
VVSAGATVRTTRWIWIGGYTPMWIVAGGAFAVWGMTQRDWMTVVIGTLPLVMLPVVHLIARADADGIVLYRFARPPQRIAPGTTRCEVVMRSPSGTPYALFSEVDSNRFLAKVDHGAVTTQWIIRAATQSGIPVTHVADPREATARPTSRSQYGIALALLGLAALAVASIIQAR